MVRPSVFASLLFSLLVPSSATSDPLSKNVEVNGIRLSYVEQGSGEPLVFVHGAMSDLRVWEPVRDAFAKHYRFIAYTQRYHGVGPWKDDGKDYSTATHADDLAKLIMSLNAARSGPASSRICCPKNATTRVA
jgi:alpha/beta hydrolase fold